MINSICILRLSAIGDVTHVIPVVLSLQEQLPGVKITWIIGKLEARLIGDLPGVEFIVFDKKAGRKGYLDCAGNSRIGSSTRCCTCRWRSGPTWPLP
ncbi:glycosyltransferase family 9 protein [Marinobacter sp. AN1]|uniref:glycosyltransferase family 9 protein n=1 Tax=Marinobacter sp. AN1 TaxID=2886046 RepID=UPI00222E7A61|nr:hypothetical protein [Marinobacter sp. AN1]UZD66643.1 hypothetical protein LJ360_04660 [Marinobacter sp. AN1]